MATLHDPGGARNARLTCELGDIFALSFVAVITAAMVATIAISREPSRISDVVIGAIALAGIGTAAGIIAVHHGRSWLPLWLFMGVQTGLTLGFVSYGFGAVFILVVTFVWMAGESRRWGDPLISRWGIVVELLGFAIGAAPLLIALS